MLYACTNKPLSPPPPPHLGLIFQPVLGEGWKGEEGGAYSNLER